jgi:hypothetical protein
VRTGRNTLHWEGIGKQKDGRWQRARCPLLVVGVGERRIAGSKGTLTAAQPAGPLSSTIPQLLQPPGWRGSGSQPGRFHEGRSGPASLPLSNRPWPGYCAWAAVFRTWSVSRGLRRLCLWNRVRLGRTEPAPVVRPFGSPAGLFWRNERAFRTQGEPIGRIRDAVAASDTEREQVRLHGWSLAVFHRSLIAAGRLTVPPVYR